MNRNIAEQLNTHLKNGTKLFICGARGVGKTYSVLQSLKDNSLNYLYINFETDANASVFFDKEENTSLIDAISGFFHIESFVLGEIYFVFDEIWASTGFIRLINSLADDEPIRLAAVSSKRIEGINSVFTVMHMYPMTFDEYLKAIGKEWYVEVIEGHFAKEKALPRLIHDELTDLYEDFLRVGGMPAAVLESIASESLENLESIQMNIAGSLYGNNSILPDSSGGLIQQRAAELISYMPAQLCEGKKKYTFSRIRKGLTFSDFIPALRKLSGDDSVIIQKRMGEENEDFRMYPLDHGILNSLIRSKVKCDENTLHDILLYASVLSSLYAKYDRVEYWSSGNSAYVDFVVTNDKLGIVPIKINATGSNRSKSLSIFDDKYAPNTCISLGNTEFKRSGEIFAVPLYAVFLL